ncbi:DUF6313 family protein [Streptomyces sp. NBC_00568]|uniref:DUF6313 family protein n=1 Tax=Streptomyces sp. NBC_00568 TaxID=2975779 RepID=UPI00225B3365|nr:DUF6313 family protein [Streptomyces sp. NBC_00568]MCX4993387.1 DUF6313 family protein [Streptomyces sp. NBC_00568]
MASPAPGVPSDTLREEVRDLVRSVAFLNRAHHWLLTRASVWLAGFGVLYLFGGFLLGWSTAYEVLVGLTAPASSRHPWYGYLLSLAGWLLVPGLTGAAAGYLVTRQIERRRSTDIAELLDRMQSQSGGPGPPAAGGGT